MQELAESEVSLSRSQLAKISEEDLRLVEYSEIRKEPLKLLKLPYLKIKTKDGRLINLSLNSTQKKLFAKIISLREARKRVRIWVLKYRQGGISTFIEGLIYALTSQQPNRNSLIMADEGDKSEYLFQMSKLYHEQLEQDSPHITPKLKKSNAKVLEFEKTHSQVIIETAENTEAARAFTYQYVHLSEVAFFRDLKAVLDGLNQSVPDHWDTIIIGETTANGIDAFNKEWNRAVEGKTDWIPLFFAWFEMAEYSMPLENGQLYPLKGINFDAETSVLQFETEETELQREFGLTNEQVNWRRWAIVNKCQGDVMRFRTEYPATWQEAFAMSGSMFFDRIGLAKQIQRTPEKVGELFYQDMKWQFRDMPHGRIEVFNAPSPNEEYILAADASEAVGSDEAGIVVLNKRLNSTAAIVAGQHTPEDLAELLIALGNWYNNGLIVPENKGYGYMVCQLVSKKYGNIYKRMITKSGTDKEVEELGFNTNSVTRPQMLAQFNEEIRHYSTQLNSARLVSECQTFVIKKDKDGKVTKVEAQDGYEDGLVICRAIAGMVRTQFPYKPKQNLEDMKLKTRRAMEEIRKTPFSYKKGKS